MDIFLSVFPIVILIFLMIKMRVPANYALPGIAGLVYFILLFYFKTDFALLNSGLVTGFWATLTPITVIMGAVLFNNFQQKTGNQAVINRWMSSITPNPVAQMMIIGYAFAFMIEGASGFGTPAAIAAPILIALGFEPLKVVIAVLIFNSIPVSFGAVGTPTWFGFGSLGLTNQQITELGLKAATVHVTAGLVIPLIALKYVFDWKEIKQNLVYIYLIVFACALPMMLLATINYEFPSLLGGAIGFIISIFLAKKRIGLKKDDSLQESSAEVDSNELFKALLPLISLVLILVVTRVPQLGIKNLLRTEYLLFKADLGIFDLEVTKALKITLANVFGTNSSESFELLYAPAFIPFFLIVFALAWLYPSMKGNVWKTISQTAHQVSEPFFALLGGVTMVKFMLLNGDQSMVSIIGMSLAAATGPYWGLFASYLGAIGAFFSGSATISNLIFGGVQQSIATQTGLNMTSILAMQSVGGAMGNMTCVNNIIAASSVSGVRRKEGYIMQKTAVPMFIYGIIAALVALFL
ncbi:TPA: L-lactate permease [Streptococcus suis]